MDTSRFLVKPHGGRLVQQIPPPDLARELLCKAESLKKIAIDNIAAADLELLAVGAYSPLEGFMTRDDYECVIEDMRLDNGMIWPLPITLTVSEEEARNLLADEEICLTDQKGRPLAIMTVMDRFRYNKGREAAYVYGTTDPAHPGVYALYNRGSVALGGPVTLLQRPHVQLREYCLDPVQVRQEIQARGWNTVVGFQTRNPLHRAHEYLQKCALEMLDGLLFHPLVGPTKDDDIPADVRFRTYQAILERYYPADRVLLATLPAPMRYAGPREAVFHALVRKNYGCTHFIVGRNHAGVGDYYGPFDAQQLLQRLAPDELGITPVFFEHAFYCRVCRGMATVKTCPHPPENHIILSGTEVRRRLAADIPIEEEFSRPEVVAILHAHARGGWMTDQDKSE